MTSKHKIGARVDEDSWDNFREFVEDKHGGTHTYLGQELQRALEEYIDDPHKEKATDDDDDDVVRHLEEIKDQLAGIDSRQEMMFRVLKQLIDTVEQQEKNEDEEDLKSVTP